MGAEGKKKTAVPRRRASIPVASLLEAVEQERKHIARELHDSFAQVTASIMRQAEFCGKLLDSPLGEDEKRELRQELAALASVARGCLSDLRKFMVNLRPASLDDLGLAPAIRRYAANFEGNAPFAIRLDLPPAMPRLPVETETHLFRMVQEALTNVSKHAAAKTVTVRMTLDATSGLTLVIADDGKGFTFNSNFAGLLANKKFGLIGLIERAQLVNGSIVIDSKEGNGTTIRVVVPIGKLAD